MNIRNNLKKEQLFLVCNLNRNLRYGNSKSRLIQFLVIRTRTFLKKIIKKNIDGIIKLGEVEIKLKHAGKMHLITADYIDRWLFTGADFEPRTVEIIEKYLNEGDSFLDIGTNIGYFSLIAANRIGNSGTVYAFEPTPSTIVRLKKNIELNDIDNIILFEKAVSNTLGVVKFKTPSGNVRNSGRSSMRSIEENAAELSVETITIDSLLNSLKKISLIKMDIEGAEGLALDGMEMLLRRDNPVIIMELTDDYLKQMGYSSQKIFQFLKRFEYKIFEVSNLNKEILDHKDLPKSQCDILCIR